MARYSRRRGPAVNFTLSAAFVLIPGMSIARSFGRGTLFICGTTLFSTGAGVVTFVRNGFTIDGALSGTDPPLIWVEPNRSTTLSFQYLEPVEPGFHTIELVAFGNAGALDVAAAVGSVLVVIELPEWDQDDDIFSL